MRTIVGLVLVAGCGNPTTADVTRAEIYAYCDVASDGITTTVALRSHPELAKEDALLLRTEAGAVKLNGYPFETAGKGPHRLGRESFTAKLPPVRSVSVGLRHQGSERWVDIRLPPAPNLSNAPGDVPAIVWEGARDTPIQVHAACAGDADPLNVVGMQLPDTGQVAVEKIFEEADLKKPALKSCEELTVVLSRVSREDMTGLGASAFLRCNAEQLRSTRITRPKPTEEADANPSP